MTSLLHIIGSLDPAKGGVSEAIRTMIPALEAFELTSEVVCLDAHDSPFINKDKFTIHALGRGIGIWDYNLKLVKWLVNNFARFDVVIIHGLWLYTGYAVRVALQQYIRKQENGNIPRIFIMPHGMLDPYFQNAIGRQFKAVRNKVYWRLVESKLVNSVDGLLFTCEEELLAARTTFPSYKPKREINIGYGINEPQQYSDQLVNDFFSCFPQIKSAGYLLFLGRIHKKKGIDLVIAAYNNLFSSVPEDTILPQLVIAGPGLNTSYGSRIASKVNNAPLLRDNIVFTGMLTGNNKWGALYGCEVFVSPSHQENFGIAIVEAMSCGKPVIISDKVNIWREIARMKAGFVAPDNLNGTLTSLRQWISLEQTSKQQMGIQAENRFKEHFSIQPAAEKLAKIIMSVH